MPGQRGGSRSDLVEDAARGNAGIGRIADGTSDDEDVRAIEDGFTRSSGPLLVADGRSARTDPGGDECHFIPERRT